MGFLSKLFKKCDQDNSSQTKMAVKLAEKIIKKYAFVMQYQMPTAGFVADVKKLPYTKEKIKQALIIGMLSTDNREVN